MRAVVKTTDNNSIVLAKLLFWLKHNHFTTAGCIKCHSTWNTGHGCVKKSTYIRQLSCVLRYNIYSTYTVTGSQLSMLLIANTAPVMYSRFWGMWSPKWGASLTVPPKVDSIWHIKHQNRCNGLGTSELEELTNDKKNPSKYAHGGGV